MLSIDMNIDRGVSSLGIFCYYGVAEDITVEKGRVDLKEYVKSLINNSLSTYNLDRIKDIPIIRSYRDVMWRLGIDPTKIRVSSEALLRRAVRSNSLPSVNNVVDSCNIASLETLVPISVFDFNKVTPPLTLRFAKLGEEIIDVDDNVRGLKGGEVVLSDSRNILHLYPHRDSKLTSVDLNTKNVLIVAYGAPGIPYMLVRDAVDKSFRYLSMFCYGRRFSEVFKVV